MGGNKGRDIREVTGTKSGRPRRSPPKKKRKAAKRKPPKRGTGKRKAGKRKPAKRCARFNPRALSLADLERGLRATPAGADLSLADLKADIEAGFPPNPDGTIDLVRYVAWLLRRHGYGRG